MFGLAPFAGAPFSSALQFTSTVPVTGFAATAQLGALGLQSGISLTLAGVGATASLGTLNANKGPVTWTSVITAQ
jgi:hypothetical protein